MSDFRDAAAAAGAQLVLGYATAAKASGYVNVSVGGEVVSVMADRDTTYAASDPVLVAKVGSQWLALGRYGTAAPTQPDIDVPPAPKPPNPVSGRLVVAPVETRSYRPNFGWRTDNTDVYQGEYGGFGNHIGCAFYGSKPRSLAGATVTSARIRVRRIGGGNFAAQTATLRLMTNATRPAGSPTLTSSTTGPRLAVGSTDNDFTVPTSWAQDIVDGTAGGLAIRTTSGSPYIVTAGKGTWGPAWTLTINWTRS